MFYAKEKFGDTGELRIGIRGDNVFCICPGCRREVCVDLAEVFNSFDVCFYTMAIYCAECSKLSNK
ncbi:MAG: hypothetical protein DDT19_01515 [Syntrophomonadaceae bacterium]|nr:hypothetical protein [Bacillota bacterium]